MSWKSIPDMKLTEKVNLKSQLTPVKVTPSETFNKAFCMQRNEKDCGRGENIKMRFLFHPKLPSQVHGWARIFSFHLHIEWFLLKQATQPETQPKKGVKKGCY